MTTFTLRIKINLTLKSLKKKKTPCTRLRFIIDRKFIDLFFLLVNKTKRTRTKTEKNLIPINK